MRDLIFFSAFCIFLVLAARNTFSAYLLWGWSGLIAVNTYLYGFMIGLPYVQIFAIITLALVLQNKDQEKEKFQLNRTIILFLIFGLHATLSATFAFPDLARNWELCTNLLKTLLFCLLMPSLVTSRFRIHATVLMLALVISFHGGLDGLKFIASGGSHLASGNPKLGDNNHYALTISMVLPLLLYLYYYSSRSLIRLGFIAVLIVTTLAVVATNSRGGLLTMMAIAVWVVLMSKRKAAGLLLIGAVASLIVVMAPDSWTERMDTINEVSSDSSFMGRVTAWKRASAIALENPVFGGGFHAGQAPSLFQQYRYKQGLLGFVDTPDVGYPAASHSIYFEVMGDLGLVGFLIFLALLINALLTRIEIKKIAKRHGEFATWAGDLSDMLAATLIAYIVGGALLSAAYFDLSYIVMMLMEVIKQQLLRDQALPKPVVAATV